MCHIVGSVLSLTAAYGAEDGGSGGSCEDGGSGGSCDCQETSPYPRDAGVEAYSCCFGGISDGMDGGKALPPRTLEVLARLHGGYAPTVPEELVLHCMRRAGDDTGDPMM